MATLRTARLIGAVAAAGCVYAAHERTASSQPLWGAPPSDCPTERAVQDRFLGVWSAVPFGRGLAAVAFVAPDPTGFELTMDIRLDGRSTQRVIHASSCETAADAYVLLVKLLLGEQVVSSDPLRPIPFAEPPSIHRVEVPSRVSKAVPFVGAGARSGVGILPWPALGGDVEGGVRFASGVRVAVEGFAYLTRHVTIGADGAGGTIDLYGATALACIPVDRFLSFAGCAGIDVGRMSGTGFGSSVTAQAGSSMWATFRPGVELSTSRSQPFSAAIRFDLPIPLFRPDFHLENRAVTEVFRPSALGLDISGHLRLEF